MPDGSWMNKVDRGARDVLILACAVSAGIHAALVPDHLHEGVPAAGGFALSAILLAALAVTLTRRVSPLLLVAAGAVLAGLIGSYLLAITTGVPFLHPDVEPVDRLALFTKAVEIAGLAAAVDLLWINRNPHSIPQPEGAFV